MAKEKKIVKSNIQTVSLIQRPIEELKAKDFLSVAETCQLLGISRTTLYRAIKEDRLKAVNIGRRVLVTRAEINRFFS